MEDASQIMRVGVRAVPVDIDWHTRFVPKTDATDWLKFTQALKIFNNW